MAELKEFEGKPVTEVGIEIRGVAGGLQEAVKFTPVEWEQGEEHYIVLRCSVKDINHEPVDKEVYDGDQRRVHVLTSLEATPIAAKIVEDAVAARREEIKKLADEAEGTPALDLSGEGDGDDLPLVDEEDQSDEALKRREYELLIEEGKGEEEARRIVYGDAVTGEPVEDKEPVNA